MRGHDVLLIVGKGPGWEDDVGRFESMGVPHDAMGINQAAVWHAPCRHAYSYHPMVMAEVKRARPDVKTHCRSASEGVDHVWRCPPLKGSSALLAADVALRRLGYSRVVLAGVPLSGEYAGHFGQAWVDQAASDQLFRERTRSMSGLTRDILGYPDKAWLGGQ